MDTLNVGISQREIEQAPTPASNVLVIGVGERHKYDGEAGLYVTDSLREESEGAVRTLEETKDVLDLMELWHMAEVVIVVDAVVGPGAPGTIHRFEICPDRGCDQVIPDNIRFSLRVLSLADAVHLAMALGKLPPRLIIYGIEATHFEWREGLSLPVLAAAKRVTKEILEYVRANSTAPAPPVPLVYEGDPGYEYAIDE